MYDFLMYFSHCNFILQRKLQIRRGRSTAGQGVSVRGSLGTERPGPAELLHVRLPRCTCTRTRDLHGGIIVQTSNANLGAASLRTNAGSYGRRVSHPVASISSESNSASTLREIVWRKDFFPCHRKKILKELSASCRAFA